MIFILYLANINGSWQSDYLKKHFEKHCDSSGHMLSVRPENLLIIQLHRQAEVSTIQISCLQSCLNNYCATSYG